MVDKLNITEKRSIGRRSKDKFDELNSYIRSIFRNCPYPELRQSTDIMAVWKNGNKEIAIICHLNGGYTYNIEINKVQEDFDTFDGAEAKKNMTDVLLRFYGEE